MIKLTKLENTDFILNCDLIETMEMTPDTIITTTSGRKYLVKETIDEIIEKVIQYKKIIFS